MESSIRWFFGQFGTSLIYRDPVLPTAGFLSSTGYSASVGEIEELVARLCELILVDPGSFALELFDGKAEKEVVTASGKSHAVGHFRMAGGRLVISLDQRETSDPGHLAAIAVHELCHLRLLGEGRIRGDRSDGERLTDLLTVYFGFGIFTTNAAMSFSRAERGFTAGCAERQSFPAGRGISIPARAFTWNRAWPTFAARPGGPREPTLDLARLSPAGAGGVFSHSSFTRSVNLQPDGILVAICEPIQPWTIFAKSPSVDRWHIGVEHARIEAPISW